MRNKTHGSSSCIETVGSTNKSFYRTTRDVLCLRTQIKQQIIIYCAFITEFTVIILVLYSRNHIGAHLFKYFPKDALVTNGDFWGSFLLVRTLYASSFFIEIYVVFLLKTMYAITIL